MAAPIDSASSSASELERIFRENHGLVFRAAYRVTGNLAGCAYLSFTVETDTAEGGYSTQTAGVLRDDITVRYLCLSLLGLLNRVEIWYRPDGPLSSGELAQVFETIYLSGAAASSGHLDSVSNERPQAGGHPREHFTASQRAQRRRDGGEPRL